jgi:hypothetical protein
MFARVFVLTFFLALAIHLSSLPGRKGTAMAVPSSRLPNSGSSSPTPNECELVAAEKEAAVRAARKRMHRAGIWTRILIVSYADEKNRHALCLFQPHRQICAYDATGTVELETSSHDARTIARALGKRVKRPIIGGVFLK